MVEPTFWPLFMGNEDLCGEVVGDLVCNVAAVDVEGLDFGW